MNFISSASLENLVPLAAYDFKETGTLQRFPYVVGVFWGSFMIVGCWVWGLFTPEVALSFADFPNSSSPVCSWELSLGDF